MEVDTDKSLIRVSKHLLDSKELRTIANFDGEIRRYLYDTCLPFEAGIQLCHFALLEQMEGKLREFAVGREGLVGELQRSAQPDAAFRLDHDLETSLLSNQL